MLQSFINFSKLANVVKTSLATCGSYTENKVHTATFTPNAKGVLPMMYQIKGKVYGPVILDISIAAINFAIAYWIIKKANHLFR